MKRVLIFSLAYHPHIGGAEVAIKEITDRIPDIEFEMVTLRFGSVQADEERIGNVLVHRIGNGSSYLDKILFIPRAARAARALHRARPFDAFWAMMSYMLLPIVLLRFRGLRNPYLLTLQEGDPWKHMFGRWFILPFRSLLHYGFRHATAVQAISTYLAGWAKRMGYRGETSIIPNGVDTEHFSFVQHQVSHTWERNTQVNLVTTSRLVQKNAIDDVIRALPLLSDTVHFVIYGIGPDEEMLRELASGLGVSARVHFKGHVDRANLPAALASADIFIRPSRSEGMGISFIEAMAAGLPVIATQEGGIADFLFDPTKCGKSDFPQEGLSAESLTFRTGWAVDKDSPEQIAEAVKDILSNPEEAREVIKNARALVLGKYDWSLIAARMCEVLTNLK